MQFREETLTRLRSWAEGVPAPPLRLILYMTNRCNLDCLFCDVPRAWKSGKEHADGELALRQWEQLVREALDLGVLEWWFPGLGETLFYSSRTLGVLEMIKGRSSSSYCHLTTNGTLFTERVCRSVVNIGIDHINFSVDGPNAEIHDMLRNTPGAFKQASGAMKTISSLKKKHGMSTPMLCITTVLTSKNYHSLPAMVDFASDVGAQGIMVNPLRVTHENAARIEVAGLQLTTRQESDVRAILSECEKKAADVGIRLQLNGWGDLEMGPLSQQCRHAEGFCPRGRRAAPLASSSSQGFYGAACFEPFYTMGIDANGKASYCASSSGIGTEDADAARFGLREVWYGPFMSKARRQMLDHIPYYSCFGCGVKSVRIALRKELLALKENP